jgi:hypothetical protein
MDRRTLATEIPLSVPRLKDAFRRNSDAMPFHRILNTLQASKKPHMFLSGITLPLRYDLPLPLTTLIIQPPLLLPTLIIEPIKFLAFPLR